MNKTELVAAVAAKAELSKKDAEKALKAFVEVVTDELKKGEKIQLVGFGTFEVSERAAREGRNPRTNETINQRCMRAGFSCPFDPERIGKALTIFAFAYIYKKCAKETNSADFAKQLVQNIKVKRLVHLVISVVIASILLKI